MPGVTKGSRADKKNSVSKPEIMLKYPHFPACRQARYIKQPFHLTDGAYGLTLSGNPD
jgi:hypothetical protein